MGLSEAIVAVISTGIYWKEERGREGGGGGGGEREGKGEEERGGEGRGEETRQIYIVTRLYDALLLTCWILARRAEREGPENILALSLHATRAPPSAPTRAVSTRAHKHAHSPVPISALIICNM